MTTRQRLAVPTAPACWPVGAWFGCQVGGTAWLLTGAAGMAWAAPPVAAVWVAAFAVANGLGTWLWRRQRSGRTPSAPLMLLACGAAGLTALVALDVARPAAGARVPVMAYLLVPGVPSLLAGLATLHRAAAAGRSAGPGAAPVPAGM